MATDLHYYAVKGEGQYLTTRQDNPMYIQRYRIKDSTIAMFEEDGVHIARPVAAGAIIELSSGPLDGDKLVDVTWEGRRVMMFTQDLRSRAEQID